MQICVNHRKIQLEEGEALHENLILTFIRKFVKIKSEFIIGSGEQLSKIGIE